jgi:hypothetical protein
MAMIDPDLDPEAARMKRLMRPIMYALATSWGLGAVGLAAWFLLRR